VEAAIVEDSQSNILAFLKTKKAASVSTSGLFNPKTNEP
jgi:hypothetical protein